MHLWRFVARNDGNSCTVTRLERDMPSTKSQVEAMAETAIS